MHTRTHTKKYTHTCTHTKKYTPPTGKIPSDGKDVEEIGLPYTAYPDTLENDLLGSDLTPPSCQQGIYSKIPRGI